MSLKKSRVIAFIGTVILSFVFHFIYDIFPNNITAIFFPVNESIWEHMKILYSSIIFYGIIDYFISRKYDVIYNNFFLNLFIISIFSILLYLAIFLPIYYNIGENMFISISLMIFVFAVVYIVSYYILKFKDVDFKFLWICLIIIVYVIFGYFTYNPIKHQLFFDTKDEIYGIKKRN